MKLPVPIAVLFSLLSAASCASCSGKLALQVLGPGGPVADDDRASSGYLLWVEGRAKSLIDAGGGVFQRFGASGADIADRDGVRVSVVGVEHGPVPALGVMIAAGGKRIAISGDQNGDNPHFTEMIKGADLLVVDHAIPASAGKVARHLHHTPAQIGTMAAKAGVGRLVLSHLMKRSLDRLDHSTAIIAGACTGPTVEAEDLMCIEPKGASDRQ